MPQERFSLLTVSNRPILLKNSPPKFCRKNFGFETAIAVKFLSAISFSTTLVVKRFLKIGDFLSTDRRKRVFQQNRPVPVRRHTLGNESHVLCRPKDVTGIAPSLTAHSSSGIARQCLNRSAGEKSGSGFAVLARVPIDGIQ